MGSDSAEGGDQHIGSYGRVFREKQEVSGQASGQDSGNDLLKVVGIRKDKGVETAKRFQG